MAKCESSCAALYERGMTGIHEVNHWELLMRIYCIRIPEAEIMGEIFLFEIALETRFRAIVGVPLQQLPLLRV